MFTSRNFSHQKAAPCLQAAEDVKFPIRILVVFFDVRAKVVSLHKLICEKTRNVNVAPLSDLV